MNCEISRYNCDSEAEHILENIMRRRNWGFGIKDQLSEFLDGVICKTVTQGMPDKLYIQIFCKKGRAVKDKTINSIDLLDEVKKASKKSQVVQVRKDTSD